MNANLADPNDVTAAAARFAAAGLCGGGPGGARGPMPEGSLSAGHYVGAADCRIADAKDGAQATYDGTLTATLLDRELVQAVLPPQARLAAPKTPSWTRHPVLCLMGRQNDPCALVGGQVQTIPTARPYNELILLIPYTVHVGLERWHSFAARMYLDDIAATAIGDLAYAYSKLLGEFDLTGSSAQVISLGRTVYEIENDDGDDDGSGAAPVWMADAQARQQLPGYEAARQVMDMPIIGYSGLYGYVRSFFEWDRSQAEVAATRCVFRFNQACRPGMQPWVALGFLETAPHAAFRVRKVRWRLSTKFPDQTLWGPA